MRTRTAESLDSGAPWAASPILRTRCSSALNSSIRFDYRLAPYDLEQSRAHARMLARSGIIGDDDLAALERGLDAVRAEIDADTFVVAPMTTRTSTWRSSAG